MDAASNFNGLRNVFVKYNNTIMFIIIMHFYKQQKRETKT